MHITGRTFNGLFEGRLTIQSANEWNPKGWICIITNDVVLNMEAQILEVHPKEAN